MYRTLFIVIIFMLIMLNTTAAVASDVTETIDSNILDGLIFIGHIGPKGEEADGEDEVVFQDGRFLSTGCSRYGFGSAPYTVTREGSTLLFSAVTRSPKHGQIDWQGEIVGETLVATYRWTKKRWYWFDANEEHWLRAQLKKE